MHIPDDLAVEILSCVTAKSVVRFRCVCKSWNSLVFNPTFVKSHLQRSPKDTRGRILFTVQNPDFALHEQRRLHCCSMKRLLHDPSSIFTVTDGALPLGEACHVVGVCNGLLCLSGTNAETRQVWVQFFNPATGLRSEKVSCIYKWFDHLSLGFGYDDSSGTYKVVAAVENWESRQFELAVHCLGHDGWRKVATWNSEFSFGYTLLPGEQLLSGTLNWVAKDTSYTNQCQIFSFDVRNERYRYMSLPSDARITGPGIGLLVLDGCLCLFYDHRRTYFAVWKMKNFGVHESWTLLVKVSYEQLQIRSFQFPSSSMLAKGDVLLLMLSEPNAKKFKIVLYNRRKKKVEHIEIRRNVVRWVANDYVPSLALPYVI